MKEDRLRSLAVCSACKKKIGETGSPMFYTVKIKNHILDAQAIQRQQGLAMQMGGNGALATILGPNEDLAVTVGEYKEFMVCINCFRGQVNLAESVE